MMLIYYLLFILFIIIYYLLYIIFKYSFTEVRQRNFFYQTLDNNRDT